MPALGTIVVLDPLDETRLDRLHAHLPEGFALTTASGRGEDDQLAALRNARFAVTGDVPVTEAMMREGAAHGLCAVHKWGVGIDNIAVEAARKRGIRVLRTTGSNARAVAETTLALMLALQRQVVAGHEGMRRGAWLKGALGPTTYLMTGKTVGLVGLGFIGKTVARLMSGFDCRLLYTKPTPLDPDEEAELGVTHVPLATLLADSDVISLHCSLNEATRGLIDAAALASTRHGVLIINTARGGIVVEDALADAVETGHVRGAALDVFATEPLPTGHRLTLLPNVIVTPHIASQAADNFGRTVGRMFENLRLLATGDEPPALDVVV